MALLVEGLGIGGDKSIEEYIIGPAEEEEEDADKDKITLYGPEEGLSWVAKPATTGQSSLGVASHHGSIANQSKSLVDPLVTLFDSVHEKLTETASMKSMLFPNFGSMFSTAEADGKNDQWDEESLQREGEGYASEDAGGDSEDNLQSPLISCQTPTSHGSILSMRRHSTPGEAVGSTGIGGGWHLAWKWTEREAKEGKKEGELKRMYLHEGKPLTASRHGSLASTPGGDVNVPTEAEYVPAAALVSYPAPHSRELLDQHPIGPAMLHPSQTSSKVPIWISLLEPGVKHALVVGIGIQMLQQVPRSLYLLVAITLLCFPGFCWIKLI